MKTFFENIKLAKVLDKQISADMRELQIAQNDLTTYFDRHGYQLAAILLGSFLAGFVSAFFLKAKTLTKIATSPYVASFKTILQLVI